MVAAELAPPPVPRPDGGPDRTESGRSGASAPRSTPERLVAAFLATVARCGYGRLTLDDVAREAGCSRATLYRYFPGKAHLARAAVASEAARYLEGLHEVAEGAADLEALLVDGLVHTARFLDDNDALQFLLRHEPAVVVSHLCFSNGDRFLRLACSALEPVLAPYLPGARCDRDCEWVARIALAYLAPENTSTDLTDPAAARELVVDFLLPSLVDRPGAGAAPTRADGPYADGPRTDDPRTEQVTDTGTTRTNSTTYTTNTTHTTRG